LWSKTNLCQLGDERQASQPSASVFLSWKFGSTRVSRLSWCRKVLFRIKPSKQIGRIEVKIQTFTTEHIGINILICGFLGRIHGKAQGNTNVNHISQKPTEKHIERKSYGKYVT
jgi:hypothetical protein